MDGSVLGGAARSVDRSGGVPPTGDTIQIGIAVDIPEPWGAQLTRRRVEAGDPLAVPAHVTLLGPTEIRTANLPAIERHLAAVAAAHLPFTLHLRGTGTFRPVTQVVFVAVAAGISECELLAAAIAAAPGLHRELRFPYHPHVTVAQDVAPDALDRVYEDLADFSAMFEVDAFTLFSHSGQARWQPRRDFCLGD
ncbi:2'-5' RNA ligase family protein [Micromonospora vinacea]|uniref:2'-5' RNA ligase family protein n=1 Tax=Micromonospora vinacea TaxID=709878 RepID=UPI003F550CA7